MNRNRLRGREATNPWRKWRITTSYGQLPASFARKGQFRSEEQQKKTFSEQILFEDLEENPLDM